MATNIVSYVMQFLTPDMIGRIAAALGLDRAQAQTGLAAAVPTLLAAFSNTAARPIGAQSMIDAIKQQSGVLDNLAGTLGGGNQSSLIDKGSSMLTSLLGSRDQSALATALGKYAGIGQGAGNSLIGLAAPLVMGAIGKQLGTQNLNASSLTGFFESQENQIAQALPGGMSKLLGGTGLLDSISGAAGSAAGAAGQAGQAGQAAGRAASASASQFASAASRTATAGRSAMPNWLYWVIPLAVIAGLLWYVVGNRTELAEHLPTPATQSIVVGGVDVRKQIDDSLDQVRTSLATVTDVPSAQTALPKLQVATTQLDKVNSLTGQMSAEQRQVVSGLVTNATTAIDQAFNRVLAIPGVGDVLKPTVDNLRTRMADISGASPTVGSGR